jgi:hypothetical protein
MLQPEFRPGCRWNLVIGTDPALCFYHPTFGALVQLLLEKRPAIIGKAPALHQNIPSRKLPLSSIKITGKL